MFTKNVFFVVAHIKHIDELIQILLYLYVLLTPYFGRFCECEWQLLYISSAKVVV